MLYRVDTEDYGPAWIWRPRRFFASIAKRFERKPLTTLGRLDYRPSPDFAWLADRFPRPDYSVFQNCNQFQEELRRRIAASRLDSPAPLFRVPGTAQLQIPLPSPSQTTRFSPSGRSKESRQGENGGSVE